MRDGEILFGPFRLDCNNQQLWRSEQQLALQPKPLAVLQYLAQHAGRLITKEELLQQVWAGTQVTPKALTVCIHAIRAILGDSGATPQCIATQGKHGYRFIAPLTHSPPVSGSRFQVSHLVIEDESPRLGTWNLELETSFVGREKELAQLQEWYAAASAGACKLVFVSGEAGIGKTTLVTRFVASLRTMEQVWISAGQSVQHHGAAEAYLPVLAALSQFARGSEQAELRAALQQYAPNWLVRMPALRREEESAPPTEPPPVVTSQRLIWELGEAFRVLTKRRPIVLVFDDLQWSDTATVEWLAYLAHWPEPLRLLIIGAYRPADIIASGHPLHAITQELRGKGQSAELRLELLNRQQVQDYCTQRFPKSSLPARVITLLHRRTDGNPLFLVRLVEYLVQHGFLTHTEGRWQLAKPVAELDVEIPNELQGMIEQQIEQLSAEEQRILEVGSVVGQAFASEVVAAGVTLPAEQVEAECDELVRKKQVIEERGVEEWPDGTITACYGFQHALFRDVVYRRLGEGRRIRLHRQIAERLEALHGEQTQEIAGVLAVHYVHGRDYVRAVRYYQQAAEQALRCSAYQEVQLHSTAGLTLLETLPDTPKRKHLELGLRQLVSPTLYSNRGFMDAELEDNLQRARQLCRELEDETTLVSILVGLGRLQMVRADRAVIAELEGEEERVAERIQDAQLLVQLHTQLATIATFRGLHARVADHYQHVLAHYDPQTSSSFLLSFGGDPFIVASSCSGMSLSLAGQPDQGWSRITQALARAEELDQPFVLVDGLLFAVVVKLLRGDYDEAWRLAQKMDALTREYNLPPYRVAGVLLQGSIAVQRGAWKEGLAGITAGLSQFQALGAQQLMPFFLSFLAEGYRRQGKGAEALQAVSDALSLTATNFDVFWEAELYRLKGEITLRQNRERATGNGQQAKITDPRSSFPNPQGEAEACFLKALEIAHRQAAKSLELRAVMSLARLWQTQGKKNEAHQMLAEIYHWFTEGFDTQDLQDAKALLDELGGEEELVNGKRGTG